MTDTNVCGHDLLVIIKYTSFVLGAALMFQIIYNTFTFSGSPNVFVIFMSLFQALFGLIIMGTACHMKFIKSNFLFMFTGWGKGCFNIFIGTLVFNNRRIDFFNKAMGWLFIITGFGYMILGQIKDIDEVVLNPSSGGGAKKKSTKKVNNNDVEKGNKATKSNATSAASSSAGPA